MTWYDVKYTSEYILIFWSQNYEENEVSAVGKWLYNGLEKNTGRQWFLQWKGKVFSEYIKYDALV